MRVLKIRMGLAVVRQMGQVMVCCFLMGLPPVGVMVGGYQGGYSAGIQVIQHYSGAIQVLEWLVEAPGSKETQISLLYSLFTL